jgi:hypothetical protein
VIYRKKEKAAWDTLPALDSMAHQLVEESEWVGSESVPEQEQGEESEIEVYWRLNRVMRYRTVDLENDVLEVLERQLKIHHPIPPPPLPLPLLPPLAPLAPLAAADRLMLVGALQILPAFDY